MRAVRAPARYDGVGGGVCHCRKGRCRRTSDPPRQYGPGPFHHGDFRRAGRRQLHGPAACRVSMTVSVKVPRCRHKARWNRSRSCRPGLVGGTCHACLATVRQRGQTQSLQHSKCKAIGTAEELCADPVAFRRRESGHGQQTVTEPAGGQRGSGARRQSETCVRPVLDLERAPSGSAQSANVDGSAKVGRCGDGETTIPNCGLRARLDHDGRQARPAGFAPHAEIPARPPVEPAPAERRCARGPCARVITADALGEASISEAWIGCRSAEAPRRRIERGSRFRPEARESLQRN